MAITIKKLFVNSESQKQFIDIATVSYDPEILESLCRAACASIPTALGIYCIDMERQVILQKWVFDTTLDPPAPARAW
jgi:hypothetical protein